MRENGEFWGWGVEIVRENGEFWGCDLEIMRENALNVGEKWGTLGLDCENNEGKTPDWGKPENLGFSWKNHEANPNPGKKRSHFGAVLLLWSSQTPGIVRAGTGN